MKVNIKILILLTCCIHSSAKEVPYDLPTEEQVIKLVEAVWKEPPQSIDVTLYKDITKIPKSAEEIRKMFEDFFNKKEGPKENLSPAELEMRNRDIQLNVEKTINEQKVGRRMKQRIRINGYRQRTDQVTAQSKMVLLEGTSHEYTRPEVLLGPNTPYDMTLVNLGDKHKGDYTSFAYYHRMKGATITDKRGSRWKRSEISRLACLPEIICLWLKIMLGQKQDTPTDPVYVPDNQKLDKLSTDELEKINVRICPDTNAPDTMDRIEIRIPKDSVEAGNIIICDREDYSRIYYYEVRNPLTGQILFTRRCSNFDSQGFPHNATLVQYNENGSIKEKEVYRIAKVQLNPSIQDDVFLFRPPVDYKVTDFRSEK